MNKTGIIGAMEIEVNLLQEQLEQCRITEKAGMSFYEGLLCGVPVVIVKSGAGKVNSAICAQILADLFDVTHIINTGVAGSLDADVDYCDIVISTEVCYHDMHNEAMGYKPGEQPRPGWLLYTADEKMIACAVEACCKVISRMEQPPAIHKGRIVTGDWFINSAERKAAVIAKFGGLCTEMEGASIGHSAYLNGIPFVVIRSISDKADDSADVDFHSFELEAARRSMEIVKEMVQKL
ncbi:MAG: 5'-methylthioadenosine/adenosylhomocysteine nucleosidase [Firmicutes bacterium]|nr:5'-methylthioadenosine/adenosylhomocysteine nucleosidase [Bacillota bacterium]